MADDPAKKGKDAKRKQIVLRLPESLWADIARWADDDFRSINGQIEYLLTGCVREHKSTVKTRAGEPHRTKTDEIL